MLIPALATASDYAPESRVWVYTADRALTETEVQTAQNALDYFVRQWTAHNQALKATAEVFHNQFILLMVDETTASAGGCSIDKSVHFLEDLGAHLGVDLLERMRFAWVKGDTLEFADRLQFTTLVQRSLIQGNTLMVNTLVKNKQELSQNWLVPFDQSWHRRIV